MSETKVHGLGTLCIHAGQEPEPVTGAVCVPIFQTSTYAQDALGSPRGGFEYARSKNPTRLALEELLAALEGGAAAHAFASGQAATASLATAHLKSGDHVVVSRGSYGGTWRYFTKVLSGFGVSFSWVDTTDLDAVRAAITPSTRMLFVETPANPTMELSDLAGPRRSRPRGVGPLPGRRSASPSTTPSRPPSSSAPSRSAPTPSSTRRRSTSTATPTPSAAPSSRRRPRTARASRSSRTRPGRSSRRSTPSS